MPVTEIERPDDLTADWLTAAIGAGTVERFSTARIGTGQMSECYRVAITYADGAAGPDSVVLKVAATDPASRQTGLALGLYEREVRFYTDIAPGIDGPVAPCYSSAYDGETGVFHLLLGDADPAVVGDEIRGATVEQAMLAMTELGRLHAPLLGQTSMADVEWLNRESPMNQALIAQLYAGFVDRYSDDIAPAHREVCERLVGGFDEYLAREAAADRVHGLVHGDYRLDNMLFGQQGADRPLTVVDWQTVTWGPATTDVAYFLGCALADDVRRDNYDALLGAYHDALGPDAALSADDVREGVRRQAFFGVMMAIVSSMLVERTERGDEMFMTMLRRHSQHVIDTDALVTLPKPAVPEALQPSAADEGAHPPGAEPLWSESWYADFVDEGQAVGGWFRLGLIPNENRAWVNGLLCGPGIPTIAVNDFEAALPDNADVVSTDAIELTHTATEPLQTYHVRLRGRGQAYDDPSALLRGEGGRAVELSMDLTWTTAGTPYQYRLTPRYEIPCTVSGTVVADGRTFELASVAGAARPLVGGAGLVEHGLGVERPAPAGRNAPARRRPANPRSATDGRRLHTAAGRFAGRARGGDGAGSVRRQRLACGHRTDAQAGRCHRHGGDKGPCTGVADRDRRAGEPFSARVGDCDNRGRPHRRRLAGVEPQPALTLAPRACVSAQRHAANDKHSAHARPDRRRAKCMSSVTPGNRLE